MIRYPGGQAGYAFRVAGLTVWGFTAMLLDRVLALGGLEQPWDSGRRDDASGRPAAGRLAPRGLAADISGGLHRPRLRLAAL